MSFYSIQIELIFVRSTADTPLIHLVRHPIWLCLVLFLGDTVHRVIDHIRRVTKLVIVTSTIVDVH